MDGIVNGWPRGEIAGPTCPVAPGTDQVHHTDTEVCTVASQWAGLCPCRAVLAGFDTTWTAYGQRDPLPKVVAS